MLAELRAFLKARSLFSDWILHGLVPNGQRVEQDPNRSGKIRKPGFSGRKHFLGNRTPVSR